MRLVHLLALTLVSVVCLSGAADGAFQRVCYLVGYNGNPHLERLRPEDIQWHLCTHIIFAFGGTVNGSLSVEPSLVSYIEEVNRSNTTHGSNVKFLISIAGPDFRFVKNETAIPRFIDSVMAFLKKYNLDGIDIDWEFPYESKDKRNFSKLLKMLRSRMDKEATRSNGQATKRYLLSVALTPIMYIADKSYQVWAISKYVDFVNLMTYDFHTPDTMPYTNYNSPMYSSKLDIFYLKYFNVYFAVHYMHSLGLRKEQIMVGIPFYGYLYYLANPLFHGVYALSNGTQVSITFREMCAQLASPTATRVFDHISKVPYLYDGNKWISYDDVESVMIKSQWIADNGFGGSMTFALNYDDYKAQCSSWKFPLQTAIYDILG